jgi:hypothetical protein
MVPGLIALTVVAGAPLHADAQGRQETRQQRARQDAALSAYADTRPDVARLWRPISKAEYGPRLRARLFRGHPLSEFYYDEQGVLLLRRPDSFVTIYDQINMLFQIETGIEPSFKDTILFVNTGESLVKKYAGKTCGDCTHRERSKFIDDQYEEAQVRAAKRYGFTVKRTDMDASATFNLPPEQATEPTDPDLLLIGHYRSLLKIGGEEFTVAYRAQLAQWIMENADRLRILDEDVSRGLISLDAAILREVEADPELRNNLNIGMGWETPKPANVIAGIKEEAIADLVSDRTGRAILRRLSGDVKAGTAPVMKVLFGDLVRAAPEIYQSDVNRFARIGVFAGPSLDPRSEDMDRVVREALRIGQSTRNLVTDCSSVQSKYTVIDPEALARTFLSWELFKGLDRSTNPLFFQIANAGAGRKPKTPLNELIAEAYRDARSITYDRERHFGQYPELYGTTPSDVINGYPCLGYCGSSSLFAIANGRIVKDMRLDYIGVVPAKGAVPEVDAAPKGPVLPGAKGSCNRMISKFDDHQRTVNALPTVYGYSRDMKLRYFGIWTIAVDYAPDGKVSRIRMRDSIAGVANSEIQDRIEAQPIAAAYEQAMKDMPYDLEVPYRDGLINGTVRIRNAERYGRDLLDGDTVHRLAGMTMFTDTVVTGADLPMRDSLLNGKATFYLANNPCGTTRFTIDFENGRRVRGSSTYEPCAS